MKVLFEQIPAQGLSPDITDVSWFPDDDIKRAGAIDAQIKLKKKHHGVSANGRLKCDVTWVCDRCLGNYVAELCTEFSITIEMQEENDPASNEAEHACSESEMDVLYVNEPVLDLSALLRQQVLLTAPAKRICKDDCKGLCSSCGSNLNMGGCSCCGEDSTSTFKILSTLKG